MSVAGPVHAKAIELARHAISMTTAAGSGHPSSAMSLLHLVVVLMYEHMRWDPADPWNPACDRLVLSEGHAVPAVYAAYADLGGVVGKSRSSASKLTIADLARLREADSLLDGHPNPAEGFPFFDSATGSLGQGLSAAAGLALAARLRNSDRRIFTIIGDGESREGQIWESADFIADHHLNSVTAIFNCNGQGQADYVSQQQSPAALGRKLAAFGWEVIPVDGHDPDAILWSLSRAAQSPRPAALVATTQKGWGAEALQDKSNHGKPVAKDKLPLVLAALDQTAARLAPSVAPWSARPKAPPAAPAPLPTGRISIAPFEQGMREAGLSDALAKNAVATRRAYGAALLALGHADPRVVALDADVSNSTFADFFAARLPQRFFECKIAEQNMITAAVGLAAAGFIPFASSFAKFLARAYDQVEMAAITRANIKLVGSHAGASLAADGPSQMSLPDVAFFRSFADVDSGGGPACVSLQPADAVAAYRLTELMANHHGMCYMRTHRPDVPLLYKPDHAFTLGGSCVLESGDAVAIVSSGYMVHVCREACTRLAARGIRCTLVDAYLFPMDPAPILAAGRSCGGRYLTVEDNYGGGLGSAVSEVIASAGAGRVSTMTCRRIPKSARSTDDIMKLISLTAADIESRVCEMCG